MDRQIENFFWGKFTLLDPPIQRIGFIIVFRPCVIRPVHRVIQAAVLRLSDMVDLDEMLVSALLERFQPVQLLVALGIEKQLQRYLKPAHGVLRQKHLAETAFPACRGQPVFPYDITFMKRFFPRSHFYPDIVPHEI